MATKQKDKADAHEVEAEAETPTKAEVKAQEESAQKFEADRKRVQKQNEEPVRLKATSSALQPPEGDDVPVIRGPDPFADQKPLPKEEKKSDKDE